MSHHTLLQLPLRALLRSSSLLSLGGGASSSVAAGLPLSLQRTYMQGAQLAAARRK